MPMLAGSRHKRIQWTFTVHFNFKFTTRKRLLLLRMGMWQKLFIINYLDINIIHYSLSTHLSLNRDCGYHCNVCIFVGWECPRSATISVHCPGSSRHQSSLNINTEDGDEGGRWVEPRPLQPLLTQLHRNDNSIIGCHHLQRRTEKQKCVDI